MGELHQKIIEEITREQQTEGVVGIVVFGSAATHEEKEDSDLDIEIISSNAAEYKLDQEQERYGIAIDFETVPLDKFLLWIRQYPYLWYDYFRRHRITYDPQHLVHNTIAELDQYFREHPEIVTFWEEKLNAMKQAKKLNQEPENCYRVYDEAEIKFSESGKVTRDFFRD